MRGFGEVLMVWWELTQSGSCGPPAEPAVAFSLFLRPWQRLWWGSEAADSLCGPVCLVSCRDQSHRKLSVCYNVCLQNKSQPCCRRWCRRNQIQSYNRDKKDSHMSINTQAMNTHSYRHAYVGIQHRLCHTFTSVSMNLHKQLSQNLIQLLLSLLVNYCWIYFVFCVADNKIGSSLTKGGTPSKQARDRISTSSSVRDRSALYLSRADTINSTEGSPQPVSSWNASHSSPHTEVKGLNREWLLCSVTTGATLHFTVLEKII